jgi:uncharacterized membrane protein
MAHKFQMGTCLRALRRIVFVITVLFVTLIIITGVVTGYIAKQESGMVGGFLGGIIISVMPLLIGGAIFLFLLFIEKRLQHRSKQ